MSWFFVRKAPPDRRLVWKKEVQVEFHSATNVAVGSAQGVCLVPVGRGLSKILEGFTSIKNKSRWKEFGNGSGKAQEGLPEHAEI